MFRTVSRFALLGLLLSVASVLSTASAATVALDNAGTVFVVRAIVSGSENDDIRGAATFAVSDPAPVGTASFTDLLGGAPFDFTVFNNQMVAIGGVPGEFVAYLIDFGTLVDNGATATVNATQNATSGPLTDPALAGLGTLSTLVLGLNFVTDLGTAPDQVLVYSLGSVSAAVTAVPEPSTVVLGGLGMLALFVTKARSRRAK